MKTVTKTVVTFEDGDMIIASTSLSGIIWIRIDGMWRHNEGYACSTDSSDDTMERHLTQIDPRSGVQWAYVGNLYHATEWEDRAHFTFNLLKD